VVLTSGSLSSATFYCHSLHGMLANKCHVIDNSDHSTYYSHDYCNNQGLNQTSATNVTSSAFINRKAISVPKYPHNAICTGILQWIYCLQANVNCRMLPQPRHISGSGNYNSVTQFHQNKVEYRHKSVADRFSWQTEITASCRALLTDARVHAWLHIVESWSDHSTEVWFAAACDITHNSNSFTWLSYIASIMTFHDLLSCSYLQHCVRSVLTGRNSLQTPCLQWVTHQCTACDKSKPSRRWIATVEPEQLMGQWSLHKNCRCRWPDLTVAGRAQLYSLPKCA